MILSTENCLGGMVRLPKHAVAGIQVSDGFTNGLRNPDSLVAPQFPTRWRSMGAVLPASRTPEGVQFEA
jgi:hypothetical protein